jgi:hypothetical protein
VYHVALELTPEQKTQLKLRATTRGQSVKSYITELVVTSLTPVRAGSKKEENTK